LSEQARRITDWRAREGVGDDRAEGSSAMGNGGQPAISLMPDVDGTGSGSLLDSIPSTLSIPDILGLKSSYCTTVLYTVLHSKVHKSTVTFEDAHV